MTTKPKTDLWKWIFLFGAVGNIGNALWMLASPVSWYETIPGGVPDFGPLNEHFVRDLGSTFFMLGTGLLWGAFSPKVRVPVLGLVVLWNVIHSLVHVLDTTRGLVGSEHWAADAPLVYSPTILLIVMFVLLVRPPEAAE